MKKYSILVVFLLFAVPNGLFAAEPMDTVKTNIEKVLSVLKNPALQGESAVSAKKEEIRKISDIMFHWPQLSKMTLGKNWDALSAEQQQEFIRLFKEILEAAYIDKILAYKDEKIDYVSNQALSETKSEVETKIVSGSSPVSIKYRLVNLGGRWGVYDVIVEGVSLAKNYRTQFRDILSKQSPADLIETLRKKVG
jgi:phospholipid transport system substrate-binding protein